MFQKLPAGSLIRRLQRRLLYTFGALVLALILSLAVGAVILSGQRNLDDLKISTNIYINGLLQTMLNQETGIRGYINTSNTAFLEPYETGRRDYSQYVQNLRATLVGSDFANTLANLETSDERASDWVNQYATLQIRRIQLNTDPNIIKSSETGGKALFDRYRESVSLLQRAADNDLGSRQRGADVFNIIVIILLAVTAFVAVVAVYRTFVVFSNNLRLQLDELNDFTDELEKGNLKARITEINNDELGRLAANFNTMAEALEQQQSTLKERDVLESVIQLNTTLTSSLELTPLVDEFVGKMLRVLKLEVGALYLVNPANGLLTLTTARGFDFNDVTPAFRLGEGLVGRVGQERESAYLFKPAESDTNGFKYKSIMGPLVPAAMYYVPLVRGTELLGVLVVGSLYAISENSRNVLNVIAVNLSSAIANSLAFQHIQSQADELERSSVELERNNTALSQQRDELRVLNSALEEANQLRSQFLSTMSHELRTPLTAIIGFSQLSLRGQEINTASVRLKNNLERILRNAQNLLGLVNDVLDIAKIEAGRMDIINQPVVLSEFMPSVIEQTQSLAIQKGLKFDYTIEDGVTSVETDPDKLRQVILNLLSNAIKFTDEGSVGVRVQAVQDDDQPAIRIEVQDSGIGIPPEMQERIFEEFYQADSSTTRKYGGTGLGLSIVRKLMSLLGGRLELVSQPELGSTFSVVLPVHVRAVNPEQATNQLYPTLLESLPPSRLKEQPLLASQLPQLLDNLQPDYPATSDTTRRILTVDDDPEILMLMQTTLEDTAYHVVALQDATRVVEIAKKIQPYAITLDVLMPELNGWQILQQLKSDPATTNIPVIMLSVVADRSAGYVLGASEFLVKPVDRDLLVKTLDRLINSSDTASVGSIYLNATNAATNASADGGPQTGAPQILGSVLVIDDDPDIREMLRQTVGEAGFMVSTAEGGETGLALANDQLPNVILLDLMMPDMSGFEVLHQLKRNPATAAIPVVILTAKSLTPPERERLRADADKIIQKGSLPMPELLNEVKLLLYKFKA